MRTTYWLVAVAAVAAAGLTVYARLRASDPPVPKVPLTAEPPRDVPELKLPPVVIPPDEPLSLPDIPGKPEPVAVPRAPKPDALPPVVPISAQEPPIAPPVSPAAPAAPTAPTIPAPPVIPPVVPKVPEPPAPRTVSPRIEPLPAIPPVAPAPSRIDSPKPELIVPEPPTPSPKVDPQPLPVPAPSPKPDPVPLPTPKPVLQPPVTPAPAPAAESGTKFVILKDDKLIEGSSVAVANDTVVVRQGALDRPFPKSQVQFVAASKDEVYKFMLARVPATDAAARLQVAKWCMFSGMREQALAEALEVKKLQPASTAAADMIRSLEASLKQFPPANAPKMTPPEAPTFPAELRPTPPPIPPSAGELLPMPPHGELRPEPDVTPEAALVFGSRVQPLLVNQCVECHAKADHESKFKLTRVGVTDAGPQATRANLRAVAAQLKKDDPGASPLLVKTLAAHGGMKRPAVADRTAAAYQALEAWVVLAVGGVKPMPAPAAPTLPAPVPPVSPMTDPDPLPPPLPIPAPTTPVSPRSPSESLPVPLPVPAVDPLLPPAPPTVDPLPAPLPPATAPAPAPLPRPVTPAPVAPEPLPVPAIEPPAPILPPAPPVTTPAPPGAGAKPVPTPLIPAAPMVPVAPPAAPVAPLPGPLPVAPPAPPGAGAKPVPAPVAPVAPGAKPAAPPAAPDAKKGPKFGEIAPPKKPAAGPAGDEFDPDAFNKGK